MKTIKPPEPQLEVTDFFQLTLDSLLAHVAILRADGTIIAVNAAWNNFATQNGLVEGVCGPGANYLRICEQATGPCSEESRAVARGIHDVSAERIPDFTMEYPCHSPSEQRWFTVRVTRFVLRGDVHIVVTHDNITERKLVEMRLQRANRLLEEQATTDVLTGVGNRRSFDKTLSREWRRHRRSGRPLSLLLLDIDEFKKFNDSLGHLAGDNALREVAETIQTAVGRPGDFLARYGGEEFAVILPETAAPGALTLANLVADELRLRRLPHPCSGIAPYLTVSIGCATMAPARGVSATELVHRADGALYRAKASGRNRIVRAEG
jgi:diguanylate cyclase (GGDEF)-like protein